MTFTVTTHDPAKRGAGQALKRGFLGQCPNCGKGHIFHKYLKVQDHCEVCGEELHHQRADDAPPYITIFVVAHIVGTLMVVVMSTWDDIPTWVNFTLWPALVIILCLILLPRIKGALVALQWALRMHGFGGADQPEIL